MNDSINAPNANQFDYTAWSHFCENAADECGSRCGASDIYFTTLLHERVSTLLKDVPEEHKQAAIEAAVKFGFVQDEGIVYQRDEGLCDLAPGKRIPC